MQKSWRGVTYCLALRGWLGLLSDSPQDHQPRGGKNNHSGLGLPIIKPLPHRLAYSLILWRQSLSCSFLLSNASNLYQVDVSQAAPSATYHLCDCEQNNWSSHNWKQELGGNQQMSGDELAGAWLPHLPSTNLISDVVLNTGLLFLPVPPLVRAVKSFSGMHNGAYNSSLPCGMGWWAAAPCSSNCSETQGSTCLCLPKCWD